MLELCSRSRRGAHHLQCWIPLSGACIAEELMLRRLTSEILGGEDGARAACSCRCGGLFSGCIGSSSWQLSEGCHGRGDGLCLELLALIWPGCAQVDAIMAIKSDYEVKKNWMGDPCFPAEYAWNGVKCSNTSDNTTRITLRAVSIYCEDLSDSNLCGTISTKFILLTALENLDLSHNNLSGSIPDSLPSLPSLQVLNLSGNHLNGNSLCKSYTGSLILRYDSDENVCNQIKSSRKRVVVLIASVVVSVLVIAALFLVYFTWRAKRKPTVSTDGHAINVRIENVPRSNKDQGDHLQGTENRRFTYKDLEKFTDNFERFIGKGGFGLVYYGCLEDGTEVAVKLRSESSSHGLDEFLAEVQSLTKVHHRNIVSLVGYCWENDHLALVYEYMSQGKKNDHLRGKNHAAETLTWGTRLRIVLEAAQGLDYLHKGCSPPIIHRDVKSSNILLGQNLQAKIADLGLSRTYLSDVQTHISATAAGTPGFMDPEYYLNGRLTESSDVYSFGVVLLEAVTGEPPMVPGHGHIIQRIKQRVAMGDIDSVADRRLGDAYDVNSMWKVVDTALMCTADAGTGRPTMADEVAQLKESLALEEARESKYSNPTSLAGSESAALISTFDINGLEDIIVGFLLQVLSFLWTIYLHFEALQCMDLLAASL